MRTGLGWAITLAALLSAGAAAEARDAPEATLRLPQQVDFTAAAGDLRGGDREIRPRGRIRTGPSDDRTRERIGLAADQIDYRLRRMGVRDGSHFRDRSRVYLFAADDERSVGYNLVHGDGGWSGEGLSLDEGAFLGDAQAGIAWRKGDIQTSFGYSHREVKRIGRVGRDREEGVVGLQFSFRPSR